MVILRKMIRGIDTMSKYAGLSARWLAWLLVLVGAYETIMRHFFNAPTVWAYETLTMSGGALYALGWSYVYLYDSHIRVDLIYRLLSKRKKALMDIISSLIFFFPLMIVLVWISTKWAVRAWRINEIMISTYWYPPAAPFRTIVALGAFLLLLQGIARFIRDLYFVIRGEPFDSIK
jgi:TRAP-type mannitol/chloroaromatic compound transport system permease small subunit